MKIWTKITIGVGAVLTAGGLIYYFMKNKNESSVVTKTEDITVPIPTPKQQIPVPKMQLYNSQTIKQIIRDPLGMMDEMLGESMEYLIKFSEACSQISTPEQVSREVNNDSPFEQAKGIMLISEKNIGHRKSASIDGSCQEQHISEDIKDKSLFSKSDKMEDILDNVIQGKRSQLNLKFPKILTKSLTLLLYKWILLSHLFLHYQEIRKLLREKRIVSKEDIDFAIKGLEAKKEKRIEKMGKRFGVKPFQTRKGALQKAFYTYQSKDPEFQLEVKHLLRIYNILQNYVNKAVKFEELEQDPLFLSQSQFQEFYQNISTLALGMQNSSILECDIEFPMYSICSSEAPDPVTIRFSQKEQEIEKIIQNKLLFETSAGIHQKNKRIFENEALSSFSSKELAKVIEMPKILPIYEQSMGAKVLYQNIDQSC